ncbi:glycosyltransferase [Limosilactobacillus agrestimuris]|uniref:glycosyltransferase n=1 Tax=Limosilactobacillus agrestimuris TaxID=2941331 RepID=UPI002041F5EB|nr:glycosyltransferase [Limosilactobacillus agrestimuris]
MNYFITSREDVHTSAIELAQVKRLQIFDYLSQPATIITMLYNYDHSSAENKLGTSGRVINLFQYYQHLSYHPDKEYDQQLIDHILNIPGYQRNANQALRDGEIRIKVTLYQDRLYCVDYLDRYGFLNRRDYYDSGCKSYTEYFEDKGRVVTRQYYNDSGQVKISYHYRGGEANVPVLTLIQLHDRDQELQFDTEMEFRAYFLDQLVANDSQALIISDRSDMTLEAFRLMKSHVRRYHVFHSAFTTDGHPDSPLSPIYEPITVMLKKGQLTGLIAATEREASEASHRFQTKNTFAIPVTFLDNEQLRKVIPEEQRQNGNFIAVARLAKVKQLDHIINAIIRLHKEFPIVQLNLYGYGDSWNHNQTTNALHKLVDEHQANAYIHFQGYHHDLTVVYETAQAEILTSEYEGFAMALLEAQGHGCPVISYDINYGPAEIIDGGVSGKLLPANDQEALYQALRQFLISPEITKKYAQHAQKAAAKFSLVKVAQKWQAFLNQQ